MDIESEDQAVAILNKKQAGYQDRELAIQFLADHPTSSAIKKLIEALLDDEFSVRWEAAVALAQLGSRAFPDVLEALTDPKLNTARLREGVMHILHYSSMKEGEPASGHKPVEVQVATNSGELVYVDELMTALKGPAADIRSMVEAGKLLFQIRNDPHPE